MNEEKTEKTIAVKCSSGKKMHYRIEYDRESCIGAAACVAAFPERWSLADDGKADLKGSKQNDDNTKQVLEITEEEFQKMKDAAEACPVSVIHITDLATGKRIV
jgi:ferredoxin